MYILYASPYRLLDSKNGAAASVGAILRAVNDAGHRCEAVTGSYSPDSLPVADQPQPVPDVANCKAAIGNILTIQYTHRGVLHSMLDENPQWDNQLLAQEMMLHLLLKEKLNIEQPDLIITTGRVSSLSRLLPLVRGYHIPLVFYLNTAKAEIHPAPLYSVDELIVPSDFLARFYYNRFGLRARVLRPIISPDLEVRRRGARFVTMVNPAPEKGLTLFYALAAQAVVKLPQARFLVVEGRWTVQAASQIGVPLLKLPNLAVLKNQRDVRRVYRRTRVLVYPSYLAEAYGRTIVEAHLSGIPVIASRRGGIPEALNGAGFLLDIPQRCLADYRAMPTCAEVRPWLRILTRLLTESCFIRYASRRATRAAACFCSMSSREAIALLEKVAARRTTNGI